MGFCDSQKCEIFSKMRFFIEVGDFGNLRAKSRKISKNGCEKRTNFRFCFLEKNRKNREGEREKTLLKNEKIENENSRNPAVFSLARKLLYNRARKNIEKDAK